MFGREVTRDRLGRVLTLRHRSSSPGKELLDVLAYEPMTRLPVRLRLPACSLLLEIQSNGSYLVTDYSASPSKSSIATSVRLNQRTGRLTYRDSLAGRVVVDLAYGDSWWDALLDYFFDAYDD